MKHNSTATRAFDLVQKSQDIGVLSISVSAARTSRSSLIQHEDRTAGEMLPKVGNNIALPLLFPYKSKLVLPGVLLAPNYPRTTSFCSRKINSLREDMPKIQ